MTKSRDIANSTSTLDVDGGTIKLDGNYPVGTANVALGNNALSSATSANDSIAIGDNALLNNTSGSDNTVVGTSAMKENTTGSNNSAYGVLALDDNTTGASNVAVGHSALRLNTTANYNTAVGWQSLYSNTTGVGHLALGTQALYSNTTSTNNNAIGNDSLYSNTTGNYNVALGTSAIRSSTTASNNTAVGYQAGYNLTTGFLNVAIGSGSLTAATTSSENVAVGQGAGQSITTNGQNTLIGRDAGDATTGDANTIVGYKGGSFQANLTSGSGNTLIGAYNDTTSASAVHAMCLGYNLDAAAGYTTLGYSSTDIRAAHGSTTWSAVSDERYKKDIVDSTAGLAFVNALQPRTFKYKNLGELPETFNAYKSGSTKVFKSSQTQHGFIAQEVKAAIDADDSIKDGFKLWDDREDGSQEVAESALIPVLVKAIQELSAKNDALEARIATLEGA